MPGNDEAEQRLRAPGPSASIIIPTYNGSARIGACLRALAPQAKSRGVEILVVDDGSSDGTAAAVGAWSGVRLLRQVNAGPAAARNHGASAAAGSVILFTDDDCEPAPDWLDAMLKPFNDPEVVGVKGVYRTRQRGVVARFVQAEYEGKYRRMRRFPAIDFIDTYSAAFVRERFQQMGGYDTEFPVACAEDVELSYRMSARGWKMVFASEAIVYHQHPDSLSRYLKKKYKFAFWRMLAVRKNPGKGARDSHTPQLMKLQLLLAPALCCSVTMDLVTRRGFPWSLGVLAAFAASTLPFSVRAAQSGLRLGLVAPFLLAARAVAQFAGVAAGFVHARRQPRRVDVPAH